MIGTLSWVGIGFLAVFLLSLWFAARAGASSGSGTSGMLAGLIACVLLMGAYLAALTIWAKSLLLAFVETELPLLTEKLLLLIEQFEKFRETI